jgi:hypothetical protein
MHALRIGPGSAVAATGNTTTATITRQDLKDMDRSPDAMDAIMT